MTAEVCSTASQWDAPETAGWYRSTEKRAPFFTRHHTWPLHNQCFSWINGPWNTASSACPDLSPTDYHFLQASQPDFCMTWSASTTSRRQKMLSRVHWKPQSTDFCAGNNKLISHWKTCADYTLSSCSRKMCLSLVNDLKFYSLKPQVLLYQPILLPHWSITHPMKKNFNTIPRF